MSDSSLEQDENGDYGPNMLDRITDFLTDNSPERLFILGAVALVLAGVCAYLGLRLQNGLSFSQMQMLMENGNLSVPNSFEDRNSVIRNIFGIVFSVFGFAFGIIGGLLPLWAVGRLIADAIHDGDNS